MSRNISCRSGNGVIYVSIEEILAYNRKSILNIDEEKEEKIFMRLANGLKSLDDFNSLSVNFEQLDWYTGCDSFYVPYFRCGSDGGIEIGGSNQNEIPVEWARSTVLILESPASMEGVNKFIDLMEVPLSTKELNSIEGILLGGGSFYKDY